MKKSSFLFLLSFCFALPAFAQNEAQTSQTVKTTETPAQVTVTINNTTSAQGNTQTTKIENSPQQTATATATATAASPKTVQDTAGTSGTSSLFGNYASSPYQSNIQVEMLLSAMPAQNQKVHKKAKRQLHKQAPCRQKTCKMPWQIHSKPFLWNKKTDSFVFLLISLS